MEGRIPIRSCVLRCVMCTRHRRVGARRLMGRLPKERVSPSRPFLNAGIDCAGPLSLETWRGKNARTCKACIALFVCLATSAVHVGLVADYKAEAFVAACGRFTGRRGVCAALWSDYGADFGGAKAALQRLFTDATVESQHFANLLEGDGTGGDSALRQRHISVINGRRE